MTPRQDNLLASARRPLRHGVTSVMAMLYMILFSVLAVGFIAMVNTSVQVAGNDVRANRAILAAESGMQFLRFHLWDLNISPATPPDELYDKVYEQLGNRLNNTANLGGLTIGRTTDVISIPAAADQWISANGDGGKFRLSITRHGKELMVKSVGKYAETAAAKGIQLTYGIFERPSRIFDYGVASKSRITMIGNTSIIGSPDPSSGSVLSTSSAAYPLTMGNSCSISGEVSFSNPDAWVDAKSGSIINNEIGESRWRDNVHHVDEPDFPIVDTSDYAPFATNIIDSKNPSGTVFENIRIKAGTNPSFTGNVTIRGVVYIEAPNQVTFGGNCNITGIIVAQTMPPGAWTSSMGTWETNTIDFRGTVTASGVQNLPNDPQFAGLHDLDGAMILAENFSVQFGGTSSSGGSTNVAGSIVASAVEFYGTADAIVDGSVINLADSAVEFQGKASVTIKSRGTTEQPHGVFFGSRYEPLPGSYLEVAP